MTLHPLLFIAVYGANLPAATPTNRPFCTLTCPPAVVATWEDLCKLQEKLIQVSPANWSSTSQHPVASGDFVLLLLKPLLLVVPSGTELS